MGRYKKRELKWVGIDYFKAYVNLPDFEKSGLYGLSRNSHFRDWDEETTIEYQADKIKDFGFYYVVRDKETNTSIAFIGISNGTKKGFIERNSFFEVTGIGLELRGGPKWFIDFAYAMGLQIRSFCRIDVTFDMECETDWTCRNVFIKKVDPNFSGSKDGKHDLKDKQGKTYTPIIKKGMIETLYLGEKKASNNTYQLLRVYNKKADARYKGKEWLYERYEGIEEITRFEIEIRRDLAQFWTVQKILDPDYIFSVVSKTWFKFNRQFFAFLHQEDFIKMIEENTLYKARLKSIRKRKEHFEQYGNDFRNDSERKQCVSTFIAYGKRLTKNGYSKDKIIEILEQNNVFLT